MKYVGSKTRISKYIIPIMLEYRKEGQFWVEPFVGGGNSIDKVENPRMGYDSNRWVIEALKSIRDNLDELPKNNLEFTEQDYSKLKYSSHKFKGWLGFVASWGGKWLGTWARSKNGRDYVREGYKNACKQSPKLQGCLLYQADYREITIPDSSLIYCDPPYKDTLKYSVNGFEDDEDYLIFWAWVREQIELGHTVFISEYQAPKDFIAVWEGSLRNSLNKSPIKSIEKLFIHKSQVKKER